MAHLKLALAVAVTLAAISVGLTPRRVALGEMLWWAARSGWPAARSSRRR